MNFALQAMSLIRMIDGNGGPPSRLRAKFEKIRQIAQQDAYGGDLGDLGAFPFAFIPWLIAVLGGGAVGASVGVGTALGYKAAELPFKVVIWGGAAWALYQLYKRR